MYDQTQPVVSRDSPWLNAREGASYARCGVRALYTAIRRGELKAVRLGGRRAVRVRTEWIDTWLEGTTQSPQVR